MLVGTTATLPLPEDQILVKRQPIALNRPKVPLDSHIHIVIYHKGLIGVNCSVAYQLL